MADGNLKWFIICTIVLLPACSERNASPSQVAPPAASGSAAPAPPRRRESREPASKDPSLKPPQGYRRMTVGGIAPTPEGNAVVLMDEDARRGLILRTTGTEALAHALHLERPHGERASTRGLLERVVQKYGGEVVGVRVDGITDEPPHGAVLLSKDGLVMELGGRPSDALALAIGKAVPVFVAESVLLESGIDIDRFDFRKLQAIPERAPETRPGEVAL